MDVRDRIHALCKERGMSLSKLAKRAGLAETTVYDWFNDNNRQPSLKALEDVCAVFEITPAQFFSEVEADKLTEQELRLLELYRKLPEKKKATALKLFEILTE